MWLLLAELSKRCCLFLQRSATVMRWCMIDKAANGHDVVLQAATPLAAVMQWFIKDFSGQVAGVLFAGYQVCTSCRLPMHAWHLS